MTGISSDIGEPHGYEPCMLPSESHEYLIWKCDAVTLVTCLVGVSSEVNVMMSESRQQNTEVRLAVGSIVDKIDRLAEKVSFYLSYLGGWTYLEYIEGTVRECLGVLRFN